MGLYLQRNTIIENTYSPWVFLFKQKKNNMVATFQSMKYILPNEYVENEMFELGLTSFFQSAMEIRLCFISWLSYRYNDLHTLQQHDCCVT